MKPEPRAFVGVDWATAEHQACVIDAAGKELGNRKFAHSGPGLAALADWVMELSGAAPGQAAVAIETPHGPVVESLQERDFIVFAISPMQLDRFRDRHFPAGQKDDRRDALVLAEALRSDRAAFRELTPPEPQILELRELSRTAEELTRERIRLQNRLRAQLWRYYPQILELTDNVAENWIMDLWEMAPTPQAAQRLSRARLGGLLKRNRIRRIDADKVREVLGQESLSVAPGTAAAASIAIAAAIERLRLNRRLLADVNARIDRLLKDFDEESPDGSGQRDAEILHSIPGVGRNVLAALLAEAWDPIKRRDYAALRGLSGSAPVTKRSGKGIIVVRRMAVHARLRNACHYMAGVAIQHDRKSRLRYDALRVRGCGHSRALRTVADRLLAVACAMLRDQTLYDPARATREKGAA